MSPLQNQGRSGMIELATHSSLLMTPQQEQALSEHIRAIAKILYEDTPKEQLATQAGPIASCP